MMLRAAGLARPEAASHARPGFGLALASMAVVLAALVVPAGAQVGALPGGRAALPEPRLALVVSRERAVVISVRSVGAAQRSLAERWQDSPPFEPFADGGDAAGVQGTPERNLASGLIIDPDGHALTNAHAVVGAAQLKIRLADGQEVAGRVLGYDLHTDIALLRLDVRGLPAARLGDPAELAVGDGVFSTARRSAWRAASRRESSAPSRASCRAGSGCP